ncbi:MAG TPA: signal peptidase I [Steroidobacteraceae bacterium]|nr:signal peptidase I [Steroidobacteraceae bacterium]
MATIQVIITVLAWLALPVVLVVLYDKFVLAPRRPKDNQTGEPVPGPKYVQIADYALPFVIVAAIMYIGVSTVFDWAKQLAVPLTWVAVPVGLYCAIDSWFLAPRRQIAKGAVSVREPILVRAMYAVLPVLVIAIIVRLISAESLDFSGVLLLLSVVTGLVWLLDHLFFRKKRELAMQKGVGGDMPMREPGTVDYARSFFPVAFAVLLVRAFLFEPFRIPSDSMMPTLLDGDFIAVNKYAYGLRLPVINKKFIDIGSPQRGDVVVFRYPPNPSVNYIKRLVGLPGDRVEVRDDRLVINGEVIAQQPDGEFADKCYSGMHLATEKLGEHTHQVMICHSSVRLFSANMYSSFHQVQGPLLPDCDRKKLLEGGGGYVCDESQDFGADVGNHVFEEVVPPGHYLMIGDNRDNSEDGRIWGYVPEENLVGKATRIWLNFDPNRSGSNMINLKRIGTAIE